MKLRSLRYLTKEGIKNIWANRLMSLASIGVLVACMTLIGLAILLTANVNLAMRNLETQNVIMAYFNDRNSVLYDNATLSSDATASAQSGDVSAESGVSSENASASSSTSSDAQSATSSQFDRDNIPEDSYLIHNEEEARAVCDEIAKLDNVNSVEFISRDQALAEMEGTIDDDVLASLLNDENGNPMSHGARITMTDLSRFDETVAQIENVTGVYKVVSREDTAQQITMIKNGIGSAGIWIIAILLVIALVIVSNTIRVTMYNRKLEISIMKAVGATNWFIRFPFIIEGVALGLLSALISEGVVYFCYRVAVESFKSSPEFGGGIIRFSEMAWQLLGIFAAIGVLAGAVGSLIMISKYLRKEGSEFRAL